MAIGIDMGAHGATTCDDELRTAHHRPQPSHARVVFDLLPRVGDQVPMIFWDEREQVQRIRPDQLFVGEILRALMATGHDATAGDGRGIAVVVPGWWTSDATSAAVSALRDAVGPKVTVLTDAEAAVRALAVEGTLVEDTLAVLDVGARTTGASIVTGGQTPHPHQLGRSLVQIDGAGDDLDTHVLHRVLAEARHDDPGTAPPSTGALLAARSKCRQAKHDLSTESATSFVLEHTLDAVPVRLVRDELDEIALAWARSATRLLASAIESSGRDITTVAVVGGGAHVPLISQTISAELGLDVLVSAQPDALAPRGALHAVAGVSHVRAPRRRPWLTITFRGRRRHRTSVHARTSSRRNRLSAPPVTTQTTPPVPPVSDATTRVS